MLFLGLDSSLEQINDVVLKTRGVYIEYAKSRAALSEAITSGSHRGGEVALVRVLAVVAEVLGERDIDDRRESLITEAGLPS